MKNLIAVVTCILFFACSSKTPIQDTTSQDLNTTTPAVDTVVYKSIDTTIQTGVLYEVRIKRKYIDKFLEACGLDKNYPDYAPRRKMNLEYSLPVTIEEDGKKYVNHWGFYGSTRTVEYSKVKKYIYISK